MELLFLPFVLLISVPGGALFPTLLLAWWVARRWSLLTQVRRVIAENAIGLWVVYAVYETRMYFWMHSVIAPIRIDLLLIAPILLLATAAAVLACAGHERHPVTASQGNVGG